MRLGHDDGSILQFMPMSFQYSQEGFVHLVRRELLQAKQDMRELGQALNGNETREMKVERDDYPLFIRGFLCDIGIR